jgi:hypothetical protein
MDDARSTRRGRDASAGDRLATEAQAAEDSTAGALNVYRFRAECEHDVNKLRWVLGLKVRRVTISIELPFPDAEVEIEADLPLEAVRDAMRQVVEGHVMVQTLARWDEYTGERDYGQ